MLVVIIGPDGCGKTSIAEGVVSEVNSSFLVKEHIATNFGILPTFGDIKKFLKKIVGLKHTNKRAHEDGEYLAGMKHEPNSKLTSSILCLWYGLDYFLGGLKIRSANRKNKLVIFARYFYDFYYQRVHLNLPHLLCNLIEFFIPTPDLIIFLKRDPESIFKIKPELTIKEIERQNSQIVRNLSNRKDFHIIDAEQGYDKTLKQIKELIEREH